LQNYYSNINRFTLIIVFLLKNSLQVIVQIIEYTNTYKKK